MMHNLSPLRHQHICPLICISILMPRPSLLLHVLALMRFTDFQALQLVQRVQLSQGISYDPYQHDFLKNKMKL